MKQKRVTILAFFLILTLMAPLASAQVVNLINRTDKVIYLYQEGLSSVIDVQRYTETGEVLLFGGDVGIPTNATPGPAPDPYPHVHVWETGIEQLGAEPTVCDGICFIDGSIINPGKWALVLWKVRIPSSSMRMASEFDRDLTLSMWVDWNQDEKWSKSELVIRESLNLSNEIPTDDGCIEVRYLTKFRVPRITGLQTNIGVADVFYKLKLWARGMLTYDDPDPSAEGERLFGEVEDYMLSYFEVIKKDVNLKKD